MTKKERVNGTGRMEKEMRRSTSSRKQERQPGRIGVSLDLYIELLLNRIERVLQWVLQSGHARPGALPTMRTLSFDFPRVYMNK